MRNKPPQAGMLLVQSIVIIIIMITNVLFQMHTHTPQEFSIWESLKFKEEFATYRIYTGIVDIWTPIYNTFQNKATFYVREYSTKYFVF